MDDRRFDLLVRLIAASPNRRGLLVGISGALAALLGRGDVGTTIAKKKPKPKGCKGSEKKCGSKCIPKSHCCNNGDCKGGQKCQGGTCKCPGGTKSCGKNCIPNEGCCTSVDCTGAEAGECVDGECVPGFAVCVTPGGGATVTFVTGNDSPPDSVRSALFEVGADGRDWAHLRNPHFAGTTLDELEILEYTTYVPADSTCGMAPYLALYVTSTEGGNDILIFTPGVGQGAELPVCEEWQTWDARNGLYRSIFHSDFAPQNDPQSLDDYQEEFGTLSLRNQDPGATECPGVVGGLRLEAGENNPCCAEGGWQNFVGFIDSLRIKLAGESAQTYDF